VVTSGRDKDYAMVSCYLTALKRNKFLKFCIYHYSREMHVSVQGGKELKKAGISINFIKLVNSQTFI